MSCNRLFGWKLCWIVCCTCGREEETRPTSSRCHPLWPRRNILSGSGSDKTLLTENVSLWDRSLLYHCGLCTTPNNSLLNPNNRSSPEHGIQHRARYRSTVFKSLEIFKNMTALIKYSKFDDMMTDRLAILHCLLYDAVWGFYSLKHLWQQFKPPVFLGLMPQALNTWIWTYCGDSWWTAILRSL